MDNVYIVFSGMRQIIAVYADREKAQEYVSECNQLFGQVWYRIISREVRK